MKLTHKDVARAHTRAVYRKIVRLIIAGELTQREIAARYKMTERDVSEIKYGTLGNHYTVDIRPNWQPPQMLSRDAIRAIYAAAWAGVPHAEISAQYCVSLALISGIKNSRRHTMHTADLERARRAALKAGVP